MSPRSFGTTFKPTLGWTPADPLDAAPGSMVSGKNLWIEAGALLPRSRLTETGQPTTFVSTGSATALVVSSPIDTNVQQLYYVEGSSTTFALWRLNNNNTVEGGGTFTRMTQQDSAATLNPTRLVTAADVLVASDEVSRVFFADGQSLELAVLNGSNLSYAQDFDNTNYDRPRNVIAFDNSPIIWGAQGGVAGETINVVIWPTGADPFDWQNVGAGSEILADARGLATRAFALEDEMVLATTKELWRGRRIGGAFRFQFSRIDRDIGIPMREAAIQTPLGIFWLNHDYMVYHYNGGAINQIGQTIQPALRSELKLDAEIAGTEKSAHFFSYDPRFRALTLHYATSSTPLGPDKAFTLFIDERVWLPQTYGSGADLHTSVFGNVDMNQTITALGEAQEQTTYFTNSLGSVVQYTPTGKQDYGNTVEGEFVSGALWGHDLTRRTLLDEVRIGIAAASASSVSISASGDLGVTFGTETQVAVPVVSAASQFRAPMLVGGDQHVVRVRSEDTGWTLNRIQVRGRDIGENL